jgi:hypothetical protein
MLFCAPDRTRAAHKARDPPLGLLLVQVGKKVKI